MLGLSMECLTFLLFSNFFIMNDIKSKQGFYDLIVNDFVGDSHMTARRFQDGKADVRIFMHGKSSHVVQDPDMIEAYIRRAWKHMLDRQNGSFQIAYNYKGYRMTYKVMANGIIKTLITKKSLQLDGKTKIETVSPEDIFFANGEHSHDGKLASMQDSAMGWIQIVNAQRLTATQ